MDELLIETDLLKERSVKPLPWEAGTSADIITVMSTVGPDDVEGNANTIEDRVLDNETQPSIMSQAIIDKLHTQFALGELSMKGMHSAMPKKKGEENQTITNKIVDIGLDRQQSKYEVPHKYPTHVGLVSKPPMYGVPNRYPTHVGLISKPPMYGVSNRYPTHVGIVSKPPMYGVPHRYPTYVEVDSKSSKYEVSQKYPTRVELDTNPSKYEVLLVSPTKKCNELPHKYPTPVELDTPFPKYEVPHKYPTHVGLETKPSTYEVPHKYPTPVELDTKPSKNELPHRHPIPVRLDTPFPEYEVPHTYPTHVGLETKPPTYEVPHTYPTHLCSGISMQQNTADGYLIENRIHGISDKTQYMVPTSSPIGSHNNPDYFSNTDECALAELNKDHQTTMKSKQPSLTDSDTEAKMNEILEMTNELNLFKLPEIDARIERTQYHKEQGLNDKGDTDFDKAISEILNSSEDENNHKQKSQVKGKRGRSRKRDITKRRTTINSSEHNSSEPMRAKERPTQEIKSSILTQGTDTDEEIDEILKSTGTLVDIKRSSATDKRLQTFKRHMHECLQTEIVDVNKMRLTLPENKTKDQRENWKKQSTILHIEPEEVRRRNRRKKLQSDMRFCTRELMMKTKPKESLSEAHTHTIKEEDIFDISPVTDRFQQSDSEDSPTKGIDALINTLSGNTAVIQNENKDISVDSEKMRDTGDDISIVKKFAIKKRESKTNSRSDTDIDIDKTKKRKKKKMKKQEKKRKCESQCFEKTNTLVIDIHVSTTDSETTQPKRKYKKRVGNKKASVGGSNELTVDDTSGVCIVRKNVKEGVHLSKLRGKDKVSHGQHTQGNTRLKRRSIEVVNEYKPARRPKEQRFVERTTLYTNREERNQVDLGDLMYDSSACCSEDEYLSASPIPWIRCLPTDVESGDLILPTTETDKQNDVVNVSEKVDGKVQVVELSNSDNTVLDNGEVEEGKTKNNGKIRKFFSRLFCCLKPKVEN